MCRLTDIEIDILVRKNEALKDEVCRLQAENDDLFFKLQGVMWSVDKWLDGKELEQDEVNRAATMREKTLQITERQQAEIERLQKERIERIRGLTKVVYDTELAEAKAEAIKEFAKFLIDKIDGGLISYTADIPDCVVDFLEMTEKE